MFDEISSHIPSHPPPPALFFACFNHISPLAVTSMSRLKMPLICKAAAGSHRRKKERTKDRNVMKRGEICDLGSLGTWSPSVRVSGKYKLSLKSPKAWHH